MVTKGIITSIDFNGNTCQVRIPLFETAGNDPIISTAVVSNTPGSYNGYKVDDVVLVAFEDGKMETPVVIGKLYLGAEKEKADPRGSLNTESLVAAKTAAVPADTKLTTDTDKNLPNTMNPYANLSSIANNLNKLNTDVNYLDVFTNNQFNSIITEIGDDGKLWTAINQNSSDISMRAMREQDAKTTGFGWNLDAKSWTLNTYKDEKIVPIFKAGNSGVAITGDLKLVNYPSTTITKYAHIPANWYKSENPRTDWIIIDNEIAYAKSPNYNSLKDIEETWKAEDVAAFPEGAGVKVGDKIWQDEQPNVDANYYTWKLTYRLTYEYNSNDDLLVEVLTDQSVFCIYYETESSDETPIKRNPPKKDEIPLPEVYETATMAHETATTAQVIAQGKTTNYYSKWEPYAADPAPEGYLAAPSLKKGDCWFDISNSGKHNETTIELTGDKTEKWSFENALGTDPDDPDAYIFSLSGSFERYADATNTRGIGKLSRGEWVKSGGLENIKNLSMCFLNEYDEVSKSQTANKLALIIPKTITVLVTNGEEITEEPVKNVDNLKLWFEQNGSITVIYQNWSTHANILKQAKTDPDTGTHLVEWEDIGGELVANKLTANYINALDITAKKINVNDTDGNTLFKANGIAGETDSNKVKIGGFDVDHNKLSIGTIGSNNSVALISDNSIEPVSIAKSSEKNDWRIVAGENFGVDSSGKTYMSDINVDGIEFDTSHSEPGKYFIIDVKATNVSNGVKFTAATLDGLLENNTDVNIKYFNSKGQQLSTTITILAGESEGSTIVKDAILDKFSWDPEYVDSTLGDFFNAYGYFNDKNKMHCAGYSFDLTPGGHGGNWDRAKAKAVSWYRITWERINSKTMTKKLVALNNAKWVTNDDIVCHAIDKHEFTKIHSIIEQWNSTKQHGIVAKTYKPTKIIARGKASSDGLSVHLNRYYGGYSGDDSISIEVYTPGITDATAGMCSMTINGETIKLEGPCWKSGSSSSSYESNLAGTSSKTGNSYNLIVSRLSAGFPGSGFPGSEFPDIGGIPGSSSSGKLNAMLTETDNNTNLPDIKTAKLITINPQFSLVHVDDSNEDVIYLYSKISNVPQIDIKNDTKQSASYIFMPLSSDPMITSIDLSESDFVKFSLEPEESAGARYFIFDDDKLNMFIYGKNYSSTWGQEQKICDVEIAANTEGKTVEKTFKLDHAPQEILGIDVDDHKVNGLNWLSVHSYVENNEIKIVLANVSNANSEAVSIDVIVNYTWQQEI